MSGAAHLAGPWPPELWELEFCLPRTPGENITARDGETLLLGAVGLNYWPAACRELLARGVDVHCRTHSGSTPLHEAAFHGKLDCVRLVLDHGANIEAQSHSGRTALHEAVCWCSRSGDPACFRLLVERGANTTAADNNGATCATLALRFKPEEEDDDDESVLKAAALDEIIKVVEASKAST